MPVLNPADYIFHVVVTQKNTADEDIDPVTANDSDKFVLSISPLRWDGVSYGSDVPADIYFSDGRAALTGVSIPHDVPYSLELTSALEQTLEVTIIDRTSGSTYFVTKEVTFAPSV